MAIGKKADDALISKNSFLVQGINLGYTRRRRTILKDVSFSLKSGEILSIQGPNGSGKSTLLKILTGVTTGYKGRYTLFTKPGYIGHHPALPFMFSVQEILQYYAKIYAQEFTCVSSILKKWDMQNTIHRSFLSLSAGQKKRLDLMRLDIWNKHLWLLDEPCTHLDASATEILMDTIDRHCQNGGGVCIVHHGNIFAKCQKFLAQTIRLERLS